MLAVWSVEKMSNNWKKLGTKHLIECHCTLKIYQGSKNHLYHKFPVYSCFDESGRIIEKISQCNNCGTLHRVLDVCKSEIIRSGKDKNVAEISKDDIACQLDVKIENILRRYNCDISTWEHVLDIIEKEAWEFPVVISREIIDQKYHLKILYIKSYNSVKILSKILDDEINF